VVGKIPQRIQKARSMGADGTTMIDNHDSHVDAISKILDFMVSVPILS
jgi:hypothetical protein